MKGGLLGIIPARGGSKGIPRKNIKPMAGRPLLAWSIAAARESKLLDDFFVSTEDAEIAAVARRYGAKVIERPPRLATDSASTLQTLQHALSLHEADAVVILQPTSPVRSAGLVDRCIRRFRRAKADNLATGFVCKFQEYGTYQKRRQELKGFFYDDGNVYVLRADLIRRGRMFGRRVERMAISREENVDIDEPFDFWLAEQILLRRRSGRRGVI